MQISEANKKIWKSTWVWIKYIMLPPAVIYIAYHQLIFEWFGNNLYVLLVLLAAILNAVMSSIDNIPHFQLSIFSKLNMFIWSKEDSWDKAPKLGSYKFDAWHIAQSLMICSFIGSLWLVKSFIWIDFIVVGYLYNVVFSAFYDIIFRKK